MATSASAKISRSKLLILVLSRFIPGLSTIGALLFVSAGTAAWRNGWLYLGTLVALMLSALVYFFDRDPELLEKRMNFKEKEKPQKLVIGLGIPIFLLAFIVPGLDYRFGISRIPLWLSIAAEAVVVFSYALIMVVFGQNRYASRVVEIQDNQRVIDTGLYSIVRHPMYLAAILLYLASALVLGSYLALVPSALIPVILVFRIKNEEKILLEGLPGYREYMKKVRYRLLPFIW